MRKYIIALFATLTLAIGTVIITTTPAHAQANVEICNSAVDLLVCINRSGGGTGDGTHIIGWHPADNNNDFEWKQENDLCNGHVTTTCPFTNTAIDRAYDGSVIVRIYSYVINKCLADGGSSGNYRLSALYGCNASGHAYVLHGCGDLGSCGDNQFSDVTNVTQTNFVGQTECLAWSTINGGIQEQLITNDDCNVDQSSNFQQAFFAL